MKKVVCVFLLAFLLFGCRDIFHPEGPSKKNDTGSNSGANGGTETPVETEPGVPSGLKTTALSKSEIMVSWTAIDEASTYEVYDGTKSYTAAFPYVVVIGLNPDTSYQFSVRAGNAHGWSEASTPVGGKTLPAGTTETLPGTPEGVSTEALSSAEIQVSWDEVSGAASYMVYYGTEKAGSSQFGGTANSPPVTVTGLQPGTGYYFTVKAGNGAGWSGGSTPVSGKTLAAATDPTPADPGTPAKPSTPAEPETPSNPADPNPPPLSAPSGVSATEQS
jgi:hypothetical protein